MLASCASEAQNVSHDQAKDKTIVGSFHHTGKEMRGAILTKDRLGNLSVPF